MLITAWGITALIALVLAWLAVTEWPNRWALAWSIAMAAVVALLWLGNLWKQKALDCEDDYDLDTRSLMIELQRVNLLLKSRSQHSTENGSALLPSAFLVLQEATRSTLWNIRTLEDRASLCRIRGKSASSASNPGMADFQVLTPPASFCSPGAPLFRPFGSFTSIRGRAPWLEIREEESELPYRSWPNTSTLVLRQLASGNYGGRR